MEKKWMFLKDWFLIIILHTSSSAKTSTNAVEVIVSKVICDGEQNYFFK